MDTDKKQRNKLCQFFQVLSHVHLCYNVFVAKDEKKHFQCLSKLHHFFFKIQLTHFSFSQSVT